MKLHELKIDPQHCFFKHYPGGQSFLVGGQKYQIPGKSGKYSLDYVRKKVNLVVFRRTS